MGQDSLNNLAVKALFALLFVVLVAGAVLLYFFPSIVADRRKHPQMSAILILNLMLGWTGLGWIVALIWSFTSNVAIQNFTTFDNNIGKANLVADELEKLAVLRDRGLITEEEFKLRKQVLFNN